MKKTLLVVLLALALVLCFGASALAETITLEWANASTKTAYTGDTVTFEAKTFTDLTAGREYRIAFSGTNNPFGATAAVTLSDTTGTVTLPSKVINDAIPASNIGWALQNKAADTNTWTAVGGAGNSGTISLMVKELYTYEESTEDVKLAEGDSLSIFGTERGSDAVVTLVPASITGATIVQGSVSVKRATITFNNAGKYIFNAKAGSDDPGKVYTIYVGDDDMDLHIKDPDSTYSYAKTWSQAHTKLTITTNNPSADMTDFAYYGGVIDREHAVDLSSTPGDDADKTVTIVAENGEETEYTVSLVIQSVGFAAALYSDDSPATTYGTYVASQTTYYVIPQEDSTALVYIDGVPSGAAVKAYLNTASSDTQTLSPIAAGSKYYAVTLNSDTTKITVSVTPSGGTPESAVYNVARPTLESVDFRDQAETGSGVKTNSFEPSALTSKYIAQRGWDYLYFTLDTVGDTSVSPVKSGPTTNSRDLDNVEKDGNYYYIEMPSELTILKIELSHACTKGGVASSETSTYLVYIYNPDYADLYIENFQVTSSNNGGGTEYLTVIDEANGKLYVFTTGKTITGLYFNIEMNDTSTKTKVYYGSNTTSNQNGKWGRFVTGTTATDYTVTVEGENGIPKEYTIVPITTNKTTSTTSTLNALTAFTGVKSNTQTTPLAMTWNAATTQYTLITDETATHLRLAGTVNSGCNVFINGERIVEGKSTTFNEIGIELDKDIDAFTFDILVVAADGTSTTSYTLTVTRGGGLLKALSATGLSGNGNLSPGFVPERKNYVGYVTSNVPSVLVSATAQSSADTVTISNTSFGGSGSGTGLSGSATATVNLTAGINIITVSVYDVSARTTTYYYLSIYRTVDKPTISVGTHQVYVNGVSRGTINSYNINNNNFLQLRDMAVLLDGTTKEFSVGFDMPTHLVTMASNSNYVINGTENSANAARYKFYGVSIFTFRLDNVYIYPIAFNLNGSNFLMLRDVGALMDFSVEYTNNIIYINTTLPYTPGR